MMITTNERVKSKLKDRKKKLQEKFFSFRFNLFQPKQNKIINCFALKSIRLKIDKMLILKLKEKNKLR